MLSLLKNKVSVVSFLFGANLCLLGVFQFIVSHICVYALGTQTQSSPVFGQLEINILIRNEGTVLSTTKRVKSKSI